VAREGEGEGAGWEEPWVVGEPGTWGLGVQGFGFKGMWFRFKPPTKLIPGLDGDLVTGSTHQPSRLDQSAILRCRICLDRSPQKMRLQLKKSLILVQHQLLARIANWSKREWLVDFHQPSRLDQIDAFQTSDLPCGTVGFRGSVQPLD